MADEVNVTTNEDHFEIRNPLILVFRESEAEGSGIICHLHAPAGYTHQSYGLIICDLVRHVANAFNVDEGDVWDWVERERYRPTTTVRSAS